jgi:hypothetical protein
MKTILKIGLGAVLVILLFAAGLLTWLILRKPAQRPPSQEVVAPTADRLARGRYLVENVTVCLPCHSDHLTTYGIPIKPGTEGQGGLVFDEKVGFPGVVAAQNLTPDRETGLGEWTDGEIVRAIREGVDRNGEALFPMMPYEHYRLLSDEDVKSIVAYLRKLKPIRNEVPPKKLDFPVNVFAKFAPKPLEGPVAAPDPSNSVAYGQYLSRVAGCYECHTPKDERHTSLPDRAFAGGFEMTGLWGRNFTANITPHPDTFVGRATKEEFIGRFRSFAGFNAETAPAVPKGRNTVMPWIEYSGMSDHDLGAIYDYLKTVKPIENRVNPFPDAK